MYIINHNYNYTVNLQHNQKEIREPSNSNLSSARSREKVKHKMRTRKQTKLHEESMSGSSSVIHCFLPLTIYANSSDFCCNFKRKGADVSKEQAGNGGVAGSLHGEGLLFVMR